MKRKFAVLPLLIFLFFNAENSYAVRNEDGNEICRFAMIVGSNNGGEIRPKLKYAVSDANAFKEVMNSMGGVARENCLILFEPDKANFISSLQKLNNKLVAAKSNYKRIELLFYYSGHSDEEGILLNDEKIYYKDIKKAIEKFPADVRIAIFDSCSSGAFNRTKGGKMRSPFLFDASYNMKGYAFMTSSSSDEASQESDKIKGSFFTHYLIAGLRGAADMSLDGRITLNEAYQFAYNETLHRTEKTINGPQHPNYNIQMTGTGDVVITDIRKSSSGLIIHKNISGRLYIRDRYDTLVGEFQKPYGRDMEIGLESGSYAILNENDGRIYNASIALNRGEKSFLNPEHLIETEKERTVARGSIEKSEAVDNEHLLNLKGNHYSGYGANFIHFLLPSIKGGGHLLLGCRGGLIINRKLIIGLSGCMVPNNIRTEVNSVDRKIVFGYGGLLFEYMLFTRRFFNISVGSTIGAGGASYIKGYKKDANNNDEPVYTGSGFFVLEPEANFIINLTKFARIGVGVAYRYCSGLHDVGLTDNNVRGFSVSIMAAIGWF